MATIVEADVVINVRLHRDDQGVNRCYVEAVSVDSAGNVVRTKGEVDVTSQLTQAQQDAGLSLLNAAEAWAKGQFQIP